MFPAFAEASQEQARAQLEAAPKPLVVAPLQEAGCVGVWSMSDLEPSARERAEREMANRSEYFEAKLRVMWPDGVDAVRLQEGNADLRIGVPTFREWVRDYYLVVGTGLDREADGRIARLTLRPPGGNRRPIGLPEDFATRLPPANGACC